ncbi:45 kDa calcium-binding protein [Caenorhabditis elegans]|uniref:45 kDa calcium-binding protein n=1 Tax=Caenorhabditis elegans TaxID=6239 RepID=Q18887_CAEEL|nr:45 kDa calcium-binding protein [Caenorhabditis elegans]CCD68180.1 45 kDa calcium-binding protein [Caenorhabditis elegans]|eukprot:NP_495338.1 Uncharacterized protein CELE_C56C10.9 [Caenorhabditis elegans]
MLKPLLAIFMISSALSIPLNRSDFLENDHVELMPLEKDGELNDKFRQEMIFSHNLDPSDSKQLSESIKEMFKKTDVNDDGFLTAGELKQQIRKNMEEHLEKSKNDSEIFFDIVDTNKDGSIVWEEFEPHFSKMHEKDHSDSELMDVHTEDPHRVDDEKRMFNRSDITRDGRLDRMEWHIFLHPEYSAQGLVEIVNDLMGVYDKNNDEVVSQDDFVNGIPGTVDELNPEFENMEKLEKERRLREFNEEIDENSDGKATFRELYDYVDPQNFRLASKEVNDIMMLTDANNDEKLSLEELLERDWLLARSSLLSARSSLHDEM